MKKQTKDLIVRAYVKYKRDNQYTQVYNSFGIDPLYCAYSKPSQYKIRAWNRIRDIDRNAVIVSHTAQFFTVGYMDTDPDTGELLFIVDTVRNKYGASIPMLDTITENINTNWLF